MISRCDQAEDRISGMEDKIGDIIRSDTWGKIMIATSRIVEILCF